MTPGEENQGNGELEGAEAPNLPEPMEKAASASELLSAQDRDIEFILDIPVTITVELGRTSMLIKDLLQLGQGSVVELSKMAGEPMEILVNDQLVARGEVVVSNDRFGVRLIDIVSPQERIEGLT